MMPILSRLAGAARLAASGFVLAALAIGIGVLMIADGVMRRLGIKRRRDDDGKG